MEKIDKPAVGGIPPQNSNTISRMAYLSNREIAAKKKSLATVRSQEGQVFERLSK
jgi:hypothetical protein